MIFPRFVTEFLREGERGRELRVYLLRNILAEIIPRSGFGPIKKFGRKSRLEKIMHRVDFLGKKKGAETREEMHTISS